MNGFVCFIYNDVGNSNQSEILSDPTLNRGFSLMNGNF